jgi:cytochrome c biogenesis protein CcmG/thiol:disulfide interchange protein DsbE
MKLRVVIPLAVFLGLSAFLWAGLFRDPHEVPSPFIGKPAPAFVLPQLQAQEQTFSPASMRGQVWLLNVWASWCAACREEHLFLGELARLGVPLVGLNYKDERRSALDWLQRYDNPYLFSAADTDGRTGISYGVYGAPETFLIDKEGVIRYKHVGPLTPKIWHDKIRPMMKQLQS